MCFRPTGITATSSPPFLPASLDNNPIPLPLTGERDVSFWRYGVRCFISVTKCKGEQCGNDGLLVHFLFERNIADDECAFDISLLEVEGGRDDIKWLESKRKVCVAEVI